MVKIQARISRSLVTIIALTFIQIVVSPFISAPVASAYTQAASVAGTTFGGTGGSNNASAIDCTNGVVTGISTSSTNNSGSFITAFSYTCRTINDDSSLSATTNTISPFATPNTADTCSSGLVAVGVRVTEANDGAKYIGAVGLICGKFLSKASQELRTIIPNIAVTGGVTSSYTCDAGKVVVGFRLRTGAGVDQLIPRCAAFTSFVYSAISVPTVASNGARTASVSFTAPTTNIADTALTETITATASNGDILRFSASSSPSTISGLIAGESYTITVSGYNAYGTSAATGSAVLDPNPVVNSEIDYALNFNGTSQYAGAPDNAIFELSASFTLEAWVYPTEVSNTYTILCKENSYQLFISGGFYGIGFSTNGTTLNYLPNTIPAAANEWHHIAVVRTSTSLNYDFYLDGVLVETADADALTSGVGPSNNSESFTIGARGNSASYKFVGKIDQVAAFNAARTASQIASDMNSHLASNTTSLNYYYDFNEGSGSLLYNLDASATSATDLTITSGATFFDVKETDTVTQSGYTLIKFPRTYITNLGGWKSPGSRISYTSLVVAGGGAGGARVSTSAGGGGGAGGMVESAARIADTNTVFGIRVGQGGFGSRTGTMTTIATGANGQNSIIQWGPSASPSLVTANGGGGGAGGYGSPPSDSSYNGSSGGSGGGASGSNTAGYAGGTSTQTSSGIDLGYGNIGGSNPGCSGYRSAGGGGGAGGVGETPAVCTKSGNGGAGRTSTITGLLYAGGGGGGSSAENVSVTAGTGGSGGGAAGGSGNRVGLTSEYLGNAGTSGTGGGGGGVGVSSGVIRGGAGGSGVVVIKFLTSPIPVYTSPVSDTTTAGLTYTFTVGGTAAVGMVRTYLWQSSTDTGTSWSNISTGSGFRTSSYTTPILETTTSGSRNQYRVIVTDTDTASTLSDTSTGVYLVINPRITISGSYSINKYGIAHTDVFTVAANTGTGVKTIKRTSTAKSNITWDTSTANIARITVAAGLTAGTYYDTLTVTDEKLATLEYPLTITVLKADTATITVASRNDTYTASSLTYVDTFTAVGLVAGDSLTSVSYGFTGIANDGVVFNLAARPAIAGDYQIIPIYTLANAASYESITVVNGQLTINRKLRTTTITTKPTTLKYSDTSTIVASTSEGTGDGTLSVTSLNQSLCTFTGFVLQAIDASGNCLYTATMGRGNNYETATSISYSTALALADTVTVTVLPISATTYSESQALITPQISISGLKLTDTATATSASFSYNSATSPTTFSVTKPTNSDTYTVQANSLTLTLGSLNRYQGVTYIDQTFRINRAQQAQLALAQYVATFGQPYSAYVFGGSGTGAITQTVTAGTAQGCEVTSGNISTTTQGTCILNAVKEQDQNYETATVSAEIYFLIWLTSSPVSTVGTGTNINLGGDTTFVVDPNRAPSISSVTYVPTYCVGPFCSMAHFDIEGIGFGQQGNTNTIVKFWRNKVVVWEDVAYTTNYVVSDTLIRIANIPSGATTGKITITTANGIAVSPEDWVAP